MSWSLYFLGVLINVMKWKKIINYAWLLLKIFQNWLKMNYENIRIIVRKILFYNDILI